MTYSFDITPIGKPRMTQSDKWRTNPNHPDPKRRERKCVTRYRQFCHDLQWLAKEQKYVLGDTLTVIFNFPMPDSWSKTKRAIMNHKPHQVKPDFDNCAKSLTDPLRADDQKIWSASITKYWAEKGSIMVTDDN